MTSLPESSDEHAAKSGGLPAPKEPWSGSVHVEVKVAATLPRIRRHGCHDADDAKADAEEEVRKELVELGYEIIDIGSRTKDDPCPPTK